MLDIIELTSGVNNVVYDIMLLMLNFYGLNLYERLTLFVGQKLNIMQFQRELQCNHIPF